MNEQVTISINGKPLRIPRGTVLASALEQAGVGRFRRSLSGESRSALCGMGVCFECRATVNGQHHQRTCLTLCQEGMEVKTDE